MIRPKDGNKICKEEKRHLRWQWGRAPYLFIIPTKKARGRGGKGDGGHGKICNREEGL